MTTPQGSLDLLNDPIAQRLLSSAIPARLAYTWTDGSPRVVPIWFHWNGAEVVFGTPPEAPKVRAMQATPQVAVTIDDNAWPYKILLLRGAASVEIVEGVAPEYAAAARRYLGAEGGDAWVAQASALLNQMARITVRPQWAGVIDFEARFPNALERAMEAAQRQQAA